MTTKPTDGEKGKGGHTMTDEARQKNLLGFYLALADEGEWAYDGKTIALRGPCAADPHDQCGLCHQPIPAGTEVMLTAILDDGGMVVGWPLCAACLETVRRGGHLLRPPTRHVQPTVESFLRAAEALLAPEQRRELAERLRDADTRGGSTTACDA